MDAFYETALDKALNWVNENFNPVGIIVTGSIIRGNPNANSDFDIFILHDENYRQRVQKYFNGVPCEIFVNNFKQVYDYFEQEYKDNRPVSAHMVATGKVVMGNDNAEFKMLVESANEYLQKSPVIDDIKETAMKYTISTMFEDATDVKETDKATCSYFLDKLMLDIIDFTFLMHSVPLPRPKERIKYLELNHPDTGKLIASYYKAESFKDQYEIAKELVLKTCGENGFFEWDSGKA